MSDRSQAATAERQGVLERIGTWLEGIMDDTGSLSRLSGAELSRLAQDTGAGSSRRLIAAAQCDRDAAEPMEDMAVVLGVDIEEARAVAPHAVRQMEIACCLCGNRQRCERELAAGTAIDDFTEFCPNAGDFIAILGEG